MNYIEYILSILNQTEKKYIDECKKCFLKEPIEIQEYLQQCSTDELFDELKEHNWSSTFEDYCKLIKYELMLRIDFKERI